jgi:hypothetical protein
MTRKHRVSSKRRSKGLSWVKGNLHAQFGEGQAAARLPLGSNPPRR